jgi:hypothetical protein
VVPSIKNTCYNGTQMIKTKLISEKIMIYRGASAPGKLYLAYIFLAIAPTLLLILRPKYPGNSVALQDP